MIIYIYIYIIHLIINEYTFLQEKFTELIHSVMHKYDKHTNRYYIQ